MKNPTDITPLTLLDYPGRAACILWYPGCNLRCPYCYNTEFINADGHPEVDAISFLEERKDFLDAVVLSGGEITLVPELHSICEKIKEIGYMVKIDTNGSHPEVLQGLLKGGLVDYVAMDNKMPSTRSWRVSGGILFDRFSECLQMLQESGISYEIRTTVHPALLNEEDILQMIQECKDLGYTGTYYLQHFFAAEKTLGNMKAPTRRYDRSRLDREAVLSIGYRNFPEDQYR